MFSTISKSIDTFNNKDKLASVAIIVRRIGSTVKPKSSGVACSSKNDNKVSCYIVEQKWYKHENKRRGCNRLLPLSISFIGNVCTTIRLTGRNFESLCNFVRNYVNVNEKILHWNNFSSLTTFKNNKKKKEHCWR